KYLGRYQVIHTSGSSGVVGLFVYGSDDWTQVKALAVARVSKGPASFFRKTRLAFIGATDGHYAGVSLVQDAPKFIFDTLPMSINKPLGDIAGKLNDFYPDVLTGYASGVNLLAEEKRRGLIRISPKRIITSADMLTSEMRATITDVFGTPPTNFYAASESLCMGAECEQNHSLHLFTDWHCFEVCSKVGDPVPEGRSGNLVLTNLYNYTEPLIRYKMNDEISVISKPCPCGSPFPRISTIAGRAEDFLWFERLDGTSDYLHPILLVEFFVPGLKKFQFIQTGRHALVMKVILDPEVDREAALGGIKARMKEILDEKKLSDAVVFAVQEADIIPHDPQTGKFKLIIPCKNK
ncbi:MAG: phenylacetate--CoA ligase family protein, partial [Parcubacteria group bacterium]|nr:phenylacetate--CoA ligase family protein [Parcubacteria group bacterium]